MTELERKVLFVPGYNYLHETGPKRRGQHGMAIIFVLIGDEGAVHWEMNTMWTPPGIVDEPDPLNPSKTLREPVHCDHTHLEEYGYGPTLRGWVNPPMGCFRAHHWKTPTYEDEDFRSGPCEWAGEAGCYTDGSGLAADDILKHFIAEGGDAVWLALEAYYEHCKQEAEATLKGVER